MQDDILAYANTWNEKIDEYYFALLNRFGRTMYVVSYDNHGRDTPIVRFDIHELSVHAGMLIGDTEPEKQRLFVKKFIDLKMLFTYLKTVDYYFHLGPTDIVVDDRTEALNPKTLSLLRGNHYMVFLISVLVECLLNTMHLLFLGKEPNFKKKKWERIINRLEMHGVDVDTILNEKDRKSLIVFKDRYRTAELHKTSSVHAMISKPKWDHFQVEERILTRCMGAFYRYVTSHSGLDSCQS